MSFPAWHVNYDANEIARRGRGCACHEPTQARAFARVVAERVYERPSTHGGALSKAGVDPVVLAAGRTSACRPFLKVEKKPAEFAACNSLADEIGPLNTPKKAFRLINEAIGNEVNEIFGIVTLDLHLRMKSIAETGRGEPSAVAAPMVPTLQAALIDGAHAVIVWHCHPSGVEAKPSQADKDTTKAFVKAFDTVNVHFIDHIITGGDSRRRSFYSFAEDGAL